MKKTRKTALALALMAVTTLAASSAFADSTSDALKSKLQGQYPSTTFTDVKPSPINGLYEVIMGRNIAYTDSTGKYMLFGHVFDMSAQKDLTADELTEISKIDVSKLPIKNAIKTVHGNGKRVMYLFSDPECPFCKQVEPELAKLDNVTIYTFPFPIESLHPGTTDVSKRIWCAKDQSAAWKQMLAKGTLPKEAATADCNNPIEANGRLGDSLGIRGTPTLIFSNGTIIPGASTAAEIEKHLSQNSSDANGAVKVKTRTGE